MFSQNFDNFILNTDSYKTSHWLQYPPNTEYVSSYIEARGGNSNFENVLFFGLQAFLKQYLTKPITNADIDEAKVLLAAHGVPFNEAGWRQLVAKHGGLLPLRIQAIPEGMVVPTGQVLCQVVNTDPEFYWLTSLSKPRYCALFGILVLWQAFLIIVNKSSKQAWKNRLIT